MAQKTSSSVNTKLPSPGALPGPFFGRRLSVRASRRMPVILLSEVSVVMAKMSFPFLPLEKIIPSFSLVRVVPILDSSLVGSSVFHRVLPVGLDNHAVYFSSSLAS